MTVQVCLVNMPYAAIERPSISLGVIKAGLKQAGFNTRVHYANIDFAELIGLDAYYWMSNSGDYTDLFGEWTFAGALFQNSRFDHERYFREHLDETFTEGTFKLLLPGRDIREVLWEIRNRSGAFIDDIAKKILLQKPVVVGCTSSVQQNCASLALLRRIREMDDTIITVMGGANCEGVMGVTLRKVFSWVDYIVSGEAEMLMPKLMNLIFQDGRNNDQAQLPTGVIGASWQESSLKESVPRAMVSDINNTPIPDYKDYFERLKRSPYSKDIKPGLPIETSRGCWWGKCTFCGLNSTALRYRAKSPQRIIEEFINLSNQYNLNKFQIVDNSINPGNVKNVFPELANIGKSFSIFCETRLIDYETLCQLEKGGIRWIQVGIESFHDKFLNSMNKGTSVLQNIQILRWAHELGIRVTYNLIYGFPREKDKWYLEMSHLIPLIIHLEPPKSIGPLRYDRFSIYQENQRTFKLHLVPGRAYRYIYDLPPEQIEDLAYFFEDNKNDNIKKVKKPGLSMLKKEWANWRYQFWASEAGRERSVLHIFGTGDERLIYDTRPCASETAVLIDKIQTHIISFCDRSRKIVELMRSFKDFKGPKPSLKKKEEAIEKLIANKYLIMLNDELLSLVVKPPRRISFQIRDFPGGFYYPSSSRVSTT